MSESWSRAVVRVDGGRGFVVEAGDERFIVTAGHCLPPLLESFPHGGLERTFPTLVGPLGAEPTVAAECVFVDPISDLAVLASPDAQEMSRDAKAFAALVTPMQPLPTGGLKFVGEIPQAESDAFLLSLDGTWSPCRVVSYGRAICIENAGAPIQGGMSGSPIVTPKGEAIGIVSVSFGDADDDREGGPNPELAAHLPVWLWRLCRVAVE